MVKTFIALFFSLFRHPQAQNTSFRSVRSTEPDSEKDVGKFRCERDSIKIKIYGSEKHKVFQSKVSFNL